MKLNVENRYSGNVEQTFASHVTESVREEACRQSGATSYQVTVKQTAGGGATVEIERVMNPQLPEHLAKLVGGRLTIHQVEEWAPPAADGSRTAAVKLTIKGQPASMHGRAVLAPDGDGSLETVTGDVKVAVPIIGRKFEPDIVKVIESALRIEQRVGDEWIKANS
ncbi:MAG TPA: DUF2505 domain-containing protein [Jatrophihabitans sp.]|nr:DUF2505 domain-containing protein [Jatrophihabitans sp.]